MSYIDFNDDSHYSGLLDGNAPPSPSPRPLAPAGRRDDSSLSLELVAGGGGGSGPGKFHTTPRSSNRQKSTRILLVKLDSDICLGEKGNSGKMCIAENCTVQTHKTNKFSTAESFKFRIKSNSNQYFMPEAGLNAVVPSLAVPFESSRDEDETKTILTHRASFNNIEHLLRSVRTAMENGNEHPWKDQMKGSSSFDNDDMSPIKTQIMRFEKEN